MLPQYCMFFCMLPEGVSCFEIQIPTLHSGKVLDTVLTLISGEKSRLKVVALPVECGAKLEGIVGG